VAQLPTYSGGPLSLAKMTGPLKGTLGRGGRGCVVGGGRDLPDRPGGVRSLVGGGQETVSVPTCGAGATGLLGGLASLSALPDDTLAV